MKLFLQVEITNWQQGGYGSALLNYASSRSNDIMGSDLDSQSDTMIADLVLRLIDQSENVFLFVLVTEPGLQLGAAQKVFAHLDKNAAKVSHAVITADHRAAETAIRHFPGFHKEADTEKIKKLIDRFGEAE